MYLNLSLLGEGANFSPVLKMAEMYSIDAEICEIDYRDSERPNFHLHHSFNCFQGNGAGTCSGDGGSPLVCPIPNSDKYMQVSIHENKFSVELFILF